MRSPRTPHPGSHESAQRPGYPRNASLAVRAAAVTCLVAVLSVLVTALAAYPLAVRNANKDARETLNRETVLVADLLAAQAASRNAEKLPIRAAGIARRLRERGIEMYVITNGRADRAGPPAWMVRQLAAGKPVAAQRSIVAARPRLVAGRPIRGVASTGTGTDGVILTTAPVTGTMRQVLSRLWLALLAGLGAGLVAGVLLARRLVRPVMDAARAAARLSAGDRSVRLATSGPAETAELSHAINELAAALATSEGRQRDFLLSVSHELRTPLTTIRGYAEALADGVVGPDGSQRAGRTVLDEAERLDRLISDLLVLARLEAADLPIEPLEVDLAELVRAAGEAWGARCAAAGLPLRVDLPGEPVSAYTDPGRLRQIIDGLLENALRVVPPGAPVVLAVTPPGAGGAPASVEVRDGGPGFTDGDLAVAFERGALYRRYQGIRKVGSGLGLALAARLTRRLGGTIEAAHAAEGGARFTVRLPVYQPRTGLYQPRTRP